MLYSRSVIFNFFKSLFFEKPEKEIFTFVGHKGPIRQLTLSPDRRHFLSVSRDGSVMLWKFPADGARHSNDFTDGFLVGSPNIKQKYWKDPHTSDGGQIRPKREFRVSDKDDHIISANFCDQFPSIFRIVTGSTCGNVIVWDASTGEILHQTGRRGYEVPSVAYIKQETHDTVIFAGDDTVLIYEFSDRIHYNSLHNGDVCKSIFHIDNKIIVVSDECITLWKNYKKDKVFQKSNGNKYHICATLTNDSNYLVVGTTLQTVYVWNFEERRLVKEFKSKGLAKSLDTFYDEDRSVHIILIGSDQKVLQQYHILPDDKEPKIANDFKFVPYWKQKRAWTALVTGANKILVFNGSLPISESDVIESKVTCTCFTVCGQNVVYGLENGEVHLFNIRHKKSKCIESNDLRKHKSVTHLQCYDPENHQANSLSSNGSGDYLDYLQFDGVIVSVFDNDTVTVYFNEKVFSRRVTKPVIFTDSTKLVLFDHTCHIFIWDLMADVLTQLNNSNILVEPVLLSTAAYCSEKRMASMVYKQGERYCLDVYTLEESNSLKLNARTKLEAQVLSSCFSCDGSLLAVGMTSGDILVWNLNKNFTSVKLSLHKCPVEKLLFSPTMEPVLVSVGETLAWWNLKRFQQMPQKKGRPKSIDILQSPVPTDSPSMNITYWADRKCIVNVDYLLARINLHGRTRCISASKDFSSFLTVDEKGKIYVMETVTPNSQTEVVQ